MKKVLVLLVATLCLVACFMVPSMAAIKYVEIDWEDVGLLYGKDVDMSGSGAEGTEVNNCRCNDSNGNKWLITGWNGPKDAYVLLGNYDMSTVQKVYIDYAMNTAAETAETDGRGPTKLSVAKKVVGDDGAVTFEDVAFVLAVPTDAKGYSEVVEAEMEILDATYQGPLYYCHTYGYGGTKANNTRAANLMLVIEDGTATEAPTEVPEITPPADDTDTQPTEPAAPATEAPATQAPSTAAPKSEDGGCGSSAAVAQVMLVLGAALIIKKKK